MNKEGARFCAECGKAMTERPEAPEVADETCPRCAVAMRRRKVGTHRTLECPMCCGLFVDATDLESMIGEQEKRVAASAGVPGERPRRSVLEAGDVTYLKCPVCSGVMNRVNYGRISGVIIDYCRLHGYWLDEGELEKIAGWVASGGLIQQRQREIDELKSRKDAMSGAALTTPMNDAAFYSADSASAVIVGGGMLKFLSRLFD